MIRDLRALRGLLRIPQAAFLIFLSLFPAAARAELWVTGGADTTGRRYLWTVRNDGGTRIESVVIPHFRVSWAKAPEGWDAEIINPRGEGGRTGTVEFRRTSPASGPSTSEEWRFEAGVVAQGAAQGRGMMRIRLNDGAERQFTVEVPVKASVWERYLTPIGFGLVVTAVVWVRRRRRPGRRIQPATASQNW